MSFITVNNVWQQYADQVVLERLNLSVNEGEFCTLVGASLGSSAVAGPSTKRAPSSRQKLIVLSYSRPNCGHFFIASYFCGTIIYSQV